MTIGAFIKMVDAGRRTKQWWSWQGEVEGKQVKIKLFKTWNQVYNIDGIEYAGPMHTTVWQWRNEIYLPWTSWGYIK